MSLHAKMVHNHNNNRIDDVELIPEVFRIIEEKENEYGLELQPSLNSLTFSSSQFFHHNESYFESEYEKYYFMDFRDPKPFYCEECKQNFTSENDLKEHCLVTFHKCDIKAICFICQESCLGLIRA